MKLPVPLKYIAPFNSNPLKKRWNHPDFQRFS